MEKIPALSTDLIKELDRLYPEMSPAPTWNDRKIWMCAEASKIVRGLVAKVKAEQAEEFAWYAHLIKILTRALAYKPEYPFARSEGEVPKRVPRQRDEPHAAATGSASRPSGSSISSTR